MNKIDISNSTKRKININNLKKRLKLYLGEKKLEKFKLTFGLHFVGKNKIQKLNNDYLKKNNPTDVLSFPIYDNLKNIKQNKDKLINLGDIFICPSVAKKYADKKNINLEDEITNLSIHGLKHLIGIHHE